MCLALTLRTPMCLAHTSLALVIPLPLLWTSSWCFHRHHVLITIMLLSTLGLFRLLTNSFTHFVPKFFNSLVVIFVHHHIHFISILLLHILLRYLLNFSHFPFLVFFKLFSFGTFLYCVMHGFSDFLVIETKYYLK